jgi:predicted metal-dependent hydrolase
MVEKYWGVANHGHCKRCSKHMKNKPDVRLYSLQFRKKQYWLCEECLIEINRFIRGKRL